MRMIERDGSAIMERSPASCSELVTDDEQVTLIYAQVMRQMRDPCQRSIVSPSLIATLDRGHPRNPPTFAGGTGLIPPGLLKTPNVIFAEQPASMEDEVLLHGDFHHDNVLPANPEATAQASSIPKGSKW